MKSPTFVAVAWFATSCLLAAQEPVGTPPVSTPPVTESVEGALPESEQSNLPQGKSSGEAPAAPEAPASEKKDNGISLKKDGSFSFNWELPNATFDFRSEGPVSFSFPDGGVKGFWLSPFMILLRCGLLILWVAVGCATAALFQPGIERLRKELREFPARSAAMGFLWLIVFWVLIFGGVVLTAILIGLPFLVVVVAFDLVLRVFGLTVAFSVVGGWVARRLNRPSVSLYTAVFLGACLLGLLRLIPFVGSVIWFAAALFGTGATLAGRFGVASNPPRFGEPATPTTLTA